MNYQVPAHTPANALERATSPLTVFQKQIWAHQHVGKDTIYKPQTVILRISGRSMPKIVEALEQVLTSAPAFSTRFQALAGGRVEATQMPEDRIKPEISPNPLSVRQLQDELAATHFQPEGDMSRILIAAQPNGTILLGAQLHPMIADARAATVFAEAVAHALEDASHPAAETPQQTDLRKGSLSYWQEIFSGEHVAACPPELSRDRGLLGTDRQTKTFVWSAHDFSALTQAAKDQKTDLQSLALSAVGGLLCRYCGVNDIRLGAVHYAKDGRTLAYCEDILPVSFHLDSGIELGALVKTISQAKRLAEANYVPSPYILQDLLRTNDSAASCIARTLVDVRPSFGTGTAGEVELLSHAPASAQGDLSIVVDPDPTGGATVSFDYAADLFRPEMIERFARHCLKLLLDFSERPETPLWRVQLVDTEELDFLSAPYPDDTPDDPRPVHQMISEHGTKRPERIAIYYGDEVWTHGRLEKTANRLANLLVSCGVAREVPVAILVKKSAEAIMANLAVLKAGGAYIPVEPEHPASRNDHILRDAGVGVVITHRKWRDKLPEDQNFKVVVLDEIDLSDQPETDPGAEIHSDQLAYIMYTSGSTGLPKGVAVEHGPLTHHNQTTSRVYEMSEDSCELPFLPFSSDGGHERWMVPLMEGGRVILPDQSLWTPAETFAAMRKHGANNASIPTTYMQQLAEWADLTDEAPPMRLYSFGGEGLPQTTFDLLAGSLKSKILINGYGPTETIMTPMVWKVHPGATFDCAYAPLGRAVGNRRVYVLDEDMNPCPVGVTGELYLGGVGIARGYVGQGAKTAERFVPDPFSKDGGRLYKSGDLTRWREDGTVEFVGRVDLQVKLRGFRIELGEIEAALLAQDDVGEALVLLRGEDADKQLVAYVVPEKDRELSPETLMRGLERQVPDYMAPSAIIVLEKMPTNPNAKLDRSALPMPTRARSKVVPADTKLEGQLLAIWKEILGHTDIGVTDNFFDIGGHSLAALRVLQAFKRQVPGDQTTIADLFNNPSIRQLAAEIEKGGRNTGKQTITLRATGEKPMLYCFPGLLVSTREYIRLVDSLGPDQPATGFLCHSLSEEKKLNVSVPEIVSRYAEEIRSQSRGRPCAFLGWSWGGLLAYEAAHQLKNDVDLKLLAMVDVCDLSEDFALGAVPQFAPGEREHLQEQVNEWLSRTGMRAEWDKLIEVMDALAYDQFLKFIGNEKEELPTDGPLVSSREHTFWVLIDNALVFRRHEIKPLDCPIRSWTAEDSLSRGLHLMDWRKLSNGAQPPDIVAGTNHLHIIGAQAFHRRLAVSLDEAFRDPAY